MKLQKHLYELLFLAGLFAAVYLYGFAFDDFSETELVRLSYVWIGAIVFGAHGLIAWELREIMAAGQAETPQEALRVRSKTEGRSLLSKLSSSMLWSFLGVRALFGGRRPVLLAVAATLIWLAGLAFFFEAIFPAL